jgi:shikimate kinase
MDPRVRAIALVGFMAAGKSTVGAELARLLGWRFLDADREFESATGRSIAEWFRDQGEAAFRVAEAELTARLLETERAILALGGGWAAQPGAFAQVPPGVRTVWLRVSATEAARRALADPVERPLLAGADAQAAARLLRSREAAYEKADLHVDVDGRTPGEVAREILHHLRVD